jgi:hypothetical protein
MVKRGVYNGLGLFDELARGILIAQAPLDPLYRASGKGSGEMAKIARGPVPAQKFVARAGEM